MTQAAPRRYSGLKKKEKETVNSETIETSLENTRCLNQEFKNLCIFTCAFRIWLVTHLLCHTQLILQLIAFSYKRK